MKEILVSVITTAGFNLNGPCYELYKYCNLPEKYKKLPDDNKADEWQKDFAQWCKKSVKELENINKKIDNINEKDDIAVSAEKQKKEHDYRVAAILNDLELL